MASPSSQGEVDEEEAAGGVTRSRGDGADQGASSSSSSSLRVIEAVLERLGLVQLELQGWRIISRDRFDFFYKSDPFQALAFLLHPPSGRFIFRVWGKSHQEGVLQDSVELDKTLWACFHQTIPCVGWSRAEKRAPSGHESIFSPACQQLIRTDTLLDLSTGFGLCEACIYHQDGRKGPALGRRSGVESAGFSAVNTEMEGGRKRPSADKEESPAKIRKVGETDADSPPWLDGDDRDLEMKEVETKEDPHQEIRQRSSGNGEFDETDSNASTTRHLLLCQQAANTALADLAQGSSPTDFATPVAVVKSEWDANQNERRGHGDAGHDVEARDVASKPNPKAKARVLKKGQEPICSLCGKKFASPRTLATHRTREHGFSVKLRCHLCKARPKYARDLASHVVERHAVRGQQIGARCPRCNDFIAFEEGDEKLFDEHFRECHHRHHLRMVRACAIRKKANLKAEGIEKPFLCTECGQGFKSDPTLQLHLIKVHGKAPKYQCDECPYGTHYPNQIKKHRERHLREKGLEVDENNKSLYVYCHVCGKKFGGKSPSGALAQHMEVHKENRQYKCEECNLTWKTRLGLHRHKIASHSSDPKYECRICGYRSLSADLKLHMATHEAPKLSCDLCGKLLRSKASLQAHRRIHTGANPYSCPLCDYVCKSNSTLCLHKKFVHNGGKHLSEHPLVIPEGATD